MSVACFSIVGGNAKNGRRERAYPTTQPVRLVDRIIQVSQSILPWQRSPQKNLARAAGVSPRSVEYWGEARGLSADALANLIRSEEGFRFLEALMDGARPKWWRICVPMMGVAAVQEMQIVARRKMRQAVQGAIDADTSISASIASAEAALPFQDENFMRPHLDAMRSVARPQNRTVAETTGKSTR